MSDKIEYKRRCDNCKFWNKITGNSGQCREESAYYDSGSSNIWPDTYDDAWCSKHRFPLTIELKLRGLTYLEQLVTSAEEGDPAALAALADMEMRAKGL